jgi:uncharacterized protein (TIGR00730 family)
VEARDFAIFSRLFSLSLLHAMKSSTKIIAVFGSSRPREGDPHYEQARQLGAALASKGFLVCSGGYGGVMEAVSRGAKEAGGKTLAVTAKFFRAHTNKWVDQEIRVETWQDRLFELIRQGNGYVVCPGGTGTLVELSVVWEMINKGVIKKKPIISLGSFWSPVIKCVREVELGHASPWNEPGAPLIHTALSPADAATHLDTVFAARKSTRR